VRESAFFTVSSAPHIEIFSRMTLVLNRTRVFDEVMKLARLLCARSIKPLEGSRP
jgi:hypothetical protein